MKITITEEGMIRTGKYVNKLRKAQEDGVIDENAHIPTATEILLELVEKIKTTINGNVIKIRGLRHLDILKWH